MSSATADIPNEIEPEYSAAVLDFNAQHFESALRLLNVLQKKAPDSPEILELKAITLKAQKNDKDAAATYLNLIQIKTKQAKDKKEIAPYAFELGVIRYKEKSWKQADSYLNYSAKNGFNVDVSHFYLGLVESQTGEWERAESNFKETLKGGVEELKPAAHYYLAQVYFKMGYPSDGFENLLSAKNTSKKFIEREDVSPESKKMAEQVQTAAESTLAPFDKSQVFGNFNFMLGYDSNVLLVPSDSVVSTGSSGKSTLKTMLSAGLGYASSPMATLQYLPSVRFNLNKNFNSASSSGEFADTTASFFLTKDALAPVSYGLKTEGTLVFQNQTDATTGSGKYRLYNTSVLFAPYLKWDESKRWTFVGEVGYRILSYNGEETVAPTLKRSGGGIQAKISAQNKTSRKYFNPTYVVRTEVNSTDGTEFKSNLYGVQLVNTMKLSNFDFAQVVTVEKTKYPDSSTSRNDTLVSLALLATKKIGPRWALVVSGDITKNTSSDATAYTYNRYTLSSGVGYSF